VVGGQAARPRGARDLPQRVARIGEDGQRAHLVGVAPGHIDREELDLGVLEE
jgi:hypothetical protein